MFTGIIEEIGSVEMLNRKGDSAVITLTATRILDDLKLGDSVAVDGICLTVCSLTGRGFSADVMPETLHRSTLGQLTRGSFVNLERALQMSSRVGGHFVSGHCDGRGTIIQSKQDENAFWYTIQVEPSLLRYLVHKGSVAVDGMSLTVAHLAQQDFSVSVIPHTLKKTALKTKREGSSVNIEVDLIGKYIERLIMHNLESHDTRTSPPAISRDFLSQHGFT